MPDQMETILKLKITQLEGKLLLYESLTKELLRIEDIQKVANEVKQKLEVISKAWDSYQLQERKNES